MCPKGYFRTACNQGFARHEESINVYTYSFVRRVPKGLHETCQVEGVRM